MVSSVGTSGAADDHDGTSAEPLEHIINEAVECTEGDDTTVGDLLSAFGSQSLGPVVLLAGLLTIIPVIGMLPGVPFVIGFVVCVFSLQFIFGNKRIWMPDHILNLSIERKRLEKAQQKSKKWLSRLDRLFTERLTFLSSNFMDRVTALLVFLLGLSMFPLGMVPGGVALPGWAFIFLGVGMTARDGLFLFLGYVLTLGSAYAIYRFVPGLL